MIELLWIAIAAIAVYIAARWGYHDGHMRGIRALKTLDQTREEWESIYDSDSAAMAKRWVEHDELHGSWANVLSNQTAAMQRMDDRVKEETAKRENLERLLGEHVNNPRPVMLNMEGIYQAMCNRDAMEHDPDSILRQSEGKDWEGGCGHS